MSGEEGERGSDQFDVRLAAARAKHRLDKAPVGAASDQGAAMGVGLRVGVELVSALAIAVAIGWGLDRVLHTMPIFIGIFVLLGGAAGVANVWRLMGRGSRPSR